MISMLKCREAVIDFTTIFSIDRKGALNKIQDAF